MKILCLDLGDQWTGMAISDALGMFARPYQTVESAKLDKELETNKEKAINKLKELDKELSKLIKSKKNFNKKITFVDGVSGTTKESLTNVLNYLIQHEFYHQGIFTCYGRIVGMGKFLFM